MSSLTYEFFLCIICKEKDKKVMSKKSSKLIEMKKIFEEIEIDFEKLNDEGIKDMINIIKM